MRAVDGSGCVLIFSRADLRVVGCQCYWLGLLLEVDAGATLGGLLLALGGAWVIRAVVGNVTLWLGRHNRVMCVTVCARGLGTCVYPVL